MAGRVLEEKDIKRMNTIINLLDPAKDAGTPSGVLKDETPPRVGEYLMGIYRSLYLTDDFSEGGLGIEMKGVGDTKKQIETKVKNILGQYIHQSFTDLKFNASGDDIFRLSNINFVIDSGYKLETIGDSTCKSIIGPFSIIDPASREINNNTRQINLHRENKTFDFTTGRACKLLNMNKYVKTIKYTYVEGVNPYNFRIEFSDGTLEKNIGTPEKDFFYNTKRVSQDLSVDGSKNEKRNAYILENFPNYGDRYPPFNQDIRFRVFWKEGGDTFQVVWPKEYYGTHGLKAENVAVATCDKVVLWRCMVNGVACLYRDGGTNKFYPILDGVERPEFILRSDTMIKKMLIDGLNSHNLSVIKTLEACVEKTEKEDFSISQFSDIDFADPTAYIRDPSFRAEAAQEVMRTLFLSMIAYIRPLIEFIGVNLSFRVADDKISLVEFRKDVYDYKCHTPFIVNKTNRVTVNTSFKQFFNRSINGESVVQWNLYSAISPLYGRQELSGHNLKPLFGNKRRISIVREEDARGKMSEEGEEEGEGPQGKKRRTEGGGSNRKKSSEKSPKTSPSQGLIQQYEKNKDLPNFLLYFIITYCQEVFYIACAYKLCSSKKSDFEKEYGFVFNTEKIRNLCSPFGKFNMDNTVEYTGESDSSISENTNEICISLCTYLKSIYKKKDSTFTLFDLCHEKLPDLLFIIMHVGKDETIEGVAPTPLTHYVATSYYQALYDEDVSLCILNKRDTISPLESVEQYRDIKIKETVKDSQEEPVSDKKHSVRELIKELKEAVSAKTAIKSLSTSVNTNRQITRTPNRGIRRKSRRGSRSGSRSASTRRKSRSGSRSASRSAASMNKFNPKMQNLYAANNLVAAQ